MLYTNFRRLKQYNFFSFPSDLEWEVTGRSIANDFRHDLCLSKIKKARSGDETLRLIFNYLQ